MRYIICVPEDCSVLALYDAVALAAGEDPTKLGYDCRRLLVAPNVFNAYRDYMTRMNQSESIGAIWLMYGPKVDETLPDNTVEVQEGFFVEK